ncbi:DUF5131 family protein [Mycolicibacterium fortuitum]|uniref:Phage Gp37/Gp68 family protein n=1 Tax=Mycolicibacterium fortuitum TaxID=1766 RepID=A0AAE4VIW1_MYCFO|nr:phage Gp37/Gp68 family protein [Mycolicibacterium fortuitum]MDV7194774.1 phage Gp37/Gp68 family protein [Mycolicibacterium fortuitum]MDV7207677.1 phage Gp37/Gp68 family protein [Mycolicibacterium fortuitum]MDV7229733.1 phage Gp37/Gp68 family protein [Mycolicibacterium fortuitum]MDV7261514.1 phage Gp37/Gp68 family protein [Mycolicibacterium fortuitum]MDV7286706.1 phage Gp37/Gp68 family protein [Mycolicibacterium fortuitum]
MSDKTGIEWTDATWNPVTGCDKVSDGCTHCYADTIAHRFAGTKAYPNGFQVTLRPDRLDQVLRWRRPRRIFVNSMSDLFHDQVPDEYIARVFAIMAVAQHHTFQILTKRHARMRSLLSRADGSFIYNALLSMFTDETLTVPAKGMLTDQVQAALDRNAFGQGWPLPNVWLGVSTENQKWADIRIPALLDTPAAIRFISAEPLLGPINLKPHLQCFHCKTTHRFSDDCDKMGRPIPHGPLAKRHIDWVIVGGESGHGARPMHHNWARNVRDHCQAASVAFLFKQWGDWRWAGEAEHPDYDAALHNRFPGAPLKIIRADGTETYELRPGNAVVQRVGKKAAGRELDGRTWDQYPSTTAAVLA